MRDLQYEKEIHKHRQKMTHILADFRQDMGNWTEKDRLGIQRALQILIEAMIGLSRYLVQQKYSISVSRSREALDELKSKGDLEKDNWEQVIRIVGFRNVLVQDYLTFNDAILDAVMENRDYLFVDKIMLEMQDKLPAKE